MMREIKCRGVDGDTKKWRYGNLCSNEHIVVIVDLITEEGEPLELEYYFIISDTVGQYTNLKDKNGKEIYEGDIVTMYIDRLSDKDTSLNERIGVIKWDYFHCGFVLAFTIKPGIESIIRATVPEWIEVIGNIHENSELL